MAVQTDLLNSLTKRDSGVLDVTRGGWTVAPRRYDFPDQDGFCAEAESLADLVRGTGGWNGITPAQSIEVVAILEAIIAGARSGQPVALE